MHNARRAPKAALVSTQNWAYWGAQALHKPVGLDICPYLPTSTSHPLRHHPRRHLVPVMRNTVVSAFRAGRKAHSSLACLANGWPHHPPHGPTVPHQTASPCSHHCLPSAVVAGSPGPAPSACRTGHWCWAAVSCPLTTTQKLPRCHHLWLILARRHLAPFLKNALAAEERNPRKTGGASMLI